MAPWLRASLDWLKRLPVGRWLGQVGKPVLVKLVQSEGDYLQSRARTLVSSGCVHLLDDEFDKWQERMLRGLDKLPMPTRAKQKARRIVVEEGDKLQEKVKSAACSNSPILVDSAFDGFQALIIKRIEAL